MWPKGLLLGTARVNKTTYPLIRPLLSAQELSSILNRPLSSIRSDISRKPWSLPPRCQAPGTKLLLWRAEDVETWLAQHVSSQIKPPPQQISSRRRGRPTKSEQHSFNNIQK
jgi:hypothetical protein